VPVPGEVDGARRPASSVLPSPYSVRVSRGETVRAVLTGLPGRLGVRGLAAVLVLALGVGTRAYLVLDARSHGNEAASRMAATVNLQTGDLPRGWSPAPVEPSAPAPSAAATPDATVDPATTFDRVVARCSGASDHTQVLTYSASSPGWTRGATAVSSEVTVVRSAEDARRDLQAQQGPRIGPCMSRDGVVPLRQMLAGQGVRVTSVAVSRLPGSAPDGFALRMRIVGTRAGKPLTLYTDSYGFVRGPVEVGLTLVSANTAPDRAAAAAALAKLRARAVAAVPLD
jgi:hypothetical protein